MSSATATAPLTMSSTAPSVKAAGSGKALGNVWLDLLRETAASRSTILTKSASLVVLGDRSCQKASLLSHFPGYVGPPPAASPSLFDYSYVSVTNRHAGDTDESYGRLRIWSVESPSHLPVLPSVLPRADEAASAAPDAAAAFAGSSASASTSAGAASAGAANGSSSSAAGAAVPVTLSPAALSSTVFAIALPLDAPHTAESSLESWLSSLSSFVSSATAALPESARAHARESVARRLALYADPGSAAAAAPLTEEEEAAATAAAVASGLPEVNMGVHVVVVGCNTATFCRSLLASASASAAAAQFDALTTRLRQICLRYGASLIFTSADAGTPAAARADVLWDWVLHLLYSLPLTAPARAAGSPLDWGVYVPAGSDSSVVIDSLLAAKPALAAALALPLDSTAFPSAPAAALEAYERVLATQSVAALDEAGLRDAIKAKQPAGQGSSSSAAASTAAAAAPAGAGAGAKSSSAAAAAVPATPVRPTVSSGSAAAAPATPGVPSLLGSTASTAGTGAGATGMVTPVHSKPTGAAPGTAAGAGAGATPAQSFFKNLLNKTAVPKATPAATPAHAPAPSGPE